MDSVLQGGGAIGSMGLTDLLVLLIPVLIGYVTKLTVDLGTKWPKVPNQLIALGGLFALCLLVWVVATVAQIDAVWAVAAVVTGYAGGSLQGTARKLNK